MFNLFEAVPYQFFQIFNSTNRVIYSNILFWLYSECENENSYTFLKEDFILIIEKYFEIYRNEDLVDEDGKELKAIRDKANWIYRVFRKYGWIDTEYIENGNLVVNIEDYALVFLNAYANYENDDESILSSYVYRIYMNLINMDHKRCYFVLKEITRQFNDLIHKLRSLNSNIKKYIKRVTKRNDKSDDDQLQEILNQLLNDYKIKVVDNAYFYMKTNDNPIKYKNRFLDECNRLRYNETYLENVISQIEEEEQVDREKAKEMFESIMNNFEESFDRIVNIIAEIDYKNSKYIKVAIERIRILMNHDNDMEGKLLNILKNIGVLTESDLSFSFDDNRNILPSSLFTPRNVVKMKPQPVELKKSEINEAYDSEILRRFRKSQQFSQKAIHNYVNTKLEEKGKVTINDFNIKSNDDFIKLILIFVYSESKKNNYKITWGTRESLVDNFYVPDFVIERKD